MQTFGRVVKIHDTDNVAVALSELLPGEQIAVGSGGGEEKSHSPQDDGILRVQDRIPAGHKIAWTDISCGEDLIKYGHPIGHATRDIRRGSWVHTHNAKTNLEGFREYRYSPDLAKSDLPEKENTGFENVGNCPVFQGYARADGRVGIRNEIWILPTVGCINGTAERLAQMARSRYAKSGIDGIFAFSHPYGCSQLGGDLENTQKILAGLIRHPNAGGVLMLGLGCENNNLAEMKKVLGTLPENTVFLNIQDVSDEIGEGMAVLETLVQRAEVAKRGPVSVSRLKIGLKCGGSDGFSGMTANPLIGTVSNRLVSLGGTAILTEVPEMFGAETILMDRCISRSVFDQVVHLINDFKSYFIRYGQTIYENPSPGNKAGGITTLEEKSLGCIQKGGTSPVMDVLRYGDPVTVAGLNLLNGPGNDLVSATALAASGAHLILFSTGRGTPFGCPVPTVKIATNTSLAEKKPNWIDFNAGALLAGLSAEQAADRLFDLICRTASGEQTGNEKNGYREIAIFKDGVTL